MNTKKDYFFIKHNSGLVKVKFEDVVFIEGLKNYAKIHTSATSFLTMTSMKELETFLPEEYFMRIHKSYIVAVDKIARLSRSKVCFSEQKCLPVGDTFRGRLGDFVAENLI
ncbi:MAG TPA: LytTR family DNA-binding domain-containing protein [Chitinophagaceae bacterium]|jgi:DNA-binding LytR/AlgR family response regulator